VDRQVFVANESEKILTSDDSNTESVRAYKGAFPSPPEVQTRAPKYVPPVDSDAEDTQATSK
jgi:hypothetical protein